MPLLYEAERAFSHFLTLEVLDHEFILSDVDYICLVFQWVV